MAQIQFETRFIFSHTLLGQKHDMSDMWARKQWQRKHKARQCSQTASIMSINYGSEMWQVPGNVSTLVEQRAFGFIIFDLPGPKQP